MTQENDHNFPPIEYLFFSYEQPNEGAWKALNELAGRWNGHHKNQFLQDEVDEISIILQKGIKDEERLALDQELAVLKSQFAIVWFAGIVDLRKPKDYEEAPYVQIVGDQYPLEFIANYKEAFGPAERCELCGKTIYDEQITDTLKVDESFLYKQIHPTPQYTPPGLDILNLPNGGMLISQKVVRILEEFNIKGYELLRVISNTTNQPSEKIFLLRAKKEILNPCVIHTPREEDAICPACGKINKGLFGFYHVREEWLSGDEIFSRHPLKYASIYVSNRLYSILKQRQLQGLAPAFGVYSCSHLMD